MSGVNTAEWLMAVDAHPQTVDTDLLVATALAFDDPHVEGLEPETVTDSIEELEDLGFLRVVLVDGAEHVLELRLPESQ
ncbi:hypothetical protein [Mycobacterium avium]|uniref:hypothetical protein n=1 Tax=Mycobacterium avium TaxID=1764 RepID=UPI001CC53A95|nr:hypothetical protein [Mycobacterium avium]MBZ4517772.1 hypothetical protein [Mycobacterium avium subsp. hominissuis]MBZ4528203.1 hypothetical protein [Mycobacterium avium subsp. hominissuis]MBZ4533611.1 hypothetical protein [Mycobacterium avium subsp. hominissuis]MBZ4546560.1 hypothetical protein [Mycobacterium avium subsp. hominissuis]MBZ4557150.1 hypothetical protein [Mycobacterium avium subsp. hominissuis]